MDADQIAAAVTAAVQAAMQANQPPAGPFARSPALAHQNVLDYSTTAGAKIFSKATEQLPTKFDLEQPNIQTLLTELNMRSATYGWASIMTININPLGAPANHKSLLEQHGVVTLERTKATVETFVNGANRQAQNDYQLLVCLTNSMDEATKRTMEHEAEQYTCGTPATRSGVMYLKHLLAKAEVTSRAMTAHVRRNLANLNDHMVEEAKHDVKRFNRYVREQVDLLGRQGETTNDLLVNLFDGYLVSTDRCFCNYIENVRNDYLDGAHITVTQLMMKAEKKYEDLVLDKKWNSPTEEQEEIVALRVQVETLKKATDSIKRPRTKDKKTSNAKKKAATKTFDGKWKWRNDAPGPGASHVRIFEDEEWKWCAHHGYWCKHLTEECEMHKKRENQEEREITAALADIGIEDIQEDQE